MVRHAACANLPPPLRVPGRTRLPVTTSVPNPEHSPADALHARVLERDPELARGLTGEEHDLAVRHLAARTPRLDPGEWTPPFAGEDGPEGTIGALVLEGVL